MFIGHMAGYSENVGGTFSILRRIFTSRNSYGPRCSTVVGITEIPNFPIGNTVRRSRIWQIPFGEVRVLQSTSNMGKVTLPIRISNLIGNFVLFFPTF